MVGIRLNIFLTVFWHIYIIPSGGFITSYGDLLSVYNTPPPPQVAALEEAPEEEGGYGEGRRPE